MELNVIDPISAKNASKVKVSETTFGHKYNEALIHQVVTAYLAGARQGSKAQKNRSDVRGGGAKPWRQKGTGRARAGTIRSPIWRSGGVTFAARPRDFTQKVNKKAYRHAIRSIFSELVRKERLVIVDDFTLQAPRTRDLLAKLKPLALDDVLIITESFDTSLLLASRNVHKVGVVCADHIDPVSLIAFTKVLITVPALKKIEEWLQ